MERIRVKRKRKKQIANITKDTIGVKRVRVLRGLSRREAAEIFKCSAKTIEKWENGRLELTPERIKKIVHGYGTTMREYRGIRHDNKTDFKELESSIFKSKKISNKERRSYQNIITKEVRVLRILRTLKNLSQDKASSLCGYARATIGHIEQGRIELSQEKIIHIVNSYGYSIENFNELLSENILRDEVLENCGKMMKKLTEEKLRVVENLLVSLSI